MRSSLSTLASDLVGVVVLFILILETVFIFSMLSR